jgi:glycosyltransferase involved in cell wall biosynthesis
MRVAIDTQSTLGRPTGIGSATRSLLNALRQLAPQHEFVELNLGADLRMRTDRRLRWQQIDLPRQARRSRADLLHVPGFDAPWLAPCPVVLTVHDLIGWLFPENLPPVARFYWARWLPASIRAADAIVVDSQQTRRDVLRLLPEVAARTRVVPLAADPRFRELPPEASAALRGRLGLPERVLLYAGTIEPRKGLDTLVEAWALVAGQLPAVELVIAGQEGWFAERLHAQVERLGLGRRVHFLGYLADEDLPALYALAELFVFPSRYEGFGLPPLEAMACGTPVIASNAASLPEVLGDAAVLVPPGDAPMLARALLLGLAQPELRAALRQRGLARAALFSWPRSARMVLEIYEATLASARPAAKRV